ncbi:hypothetical protein HK096_010426, partial [Nowakowskiella sp. JEL0078]
MASNLSHPAKSPILSFTASKAINQQAESTVPFLGSNFENFSFEAHREDHLDTKSPAETSIPEDISSASPIESESSAYLEHEIPTTKVVPTKIEISEKSNSLHLNFNRHDDVDIENENNQILEPKDSVIETKANLSVQSSIPEDLSLSGSIETTNLVKESEIKVSTVITPEPPKANLTQYDDESFEVLEESPRSSSEPQESPTIPSTIVPLTINPFHPVWATELTPDQHEEEFEDTSSRRSAASPRKSRKDVMLIISKLDVDSPQKFSGSLDVLYSPPPAPAPVNLVDHLEYIGDNDAFPNCRNERNIVEDLPYLNTEAALPNMNLSTEDVPECIEEESVEYLLGVEKEPVITPILVEVKGEALNLTAVTDDLNTKEINSEGKGHQPSLKNTIMEDEQLNLAEEPNDISNNNIDTVTDEIWNEMLDESFT